MKIISKTEKVTIIKLASPLSYDGLISTLHLSQTRSFDMPLTWLEFEYLFIAKDGAWLGDANERSSIENEGKILSVERITIAQSVALVFDDDGMNFDSDLGSLESFIYSLPLALDGDYDENVAWSSDSHHGTFDEVYTFSDGSYLAISGDAWDISCENGTSWDGCTID